MSKPAVVHFTAGNPRTPCGRRLEDAGRVTGDFSAVTCAQCRRHAHVENMHYAPQVSTPASAPDPNPAHYTRLAGARITVAPPRVALDPAATVQVEVSRDPPGTLERTWQPVEAEFVDERQRTARLRKVLERIARAPSRALARQWAREALRAETD